MRHLPRLLLLALLAAAADAQVSPAPPPSDAPPPLDAPPSAPDAANPIIGKWKFALASICSEIHQFRADGTETVTSGEQVAQGLYEISPRPSRKGYYKLDERMASDNGKAACSGGLRPGQEATSFVLLHRSGTMIILCQDESFDSCVGPLTRITDPG